MCCITDDKGGIRPHHEGRAKTRSLKQSSPEAMQNAKTQDAPTQAAFTQAPDISTVVVSLQAERFEEWRSKLRSAIRYDADPMDSIQKETPHGTLRLNLREASYRGGAYVQATLEDGGEVKWTSSPVYRVGQGAPTVIGSEGNRLELVVQQE